MAIPTYETKISKITQETPATITLRIDMPDFTFKAGQFVMVLMPLNGKEERRAYSISSSPDEEGYIELTVKLENPSKGGSKWLHERKEGDPIKVMGPFGHFTVDDSQHVVLLAAGSGIAPFRSMWRWRAKHTKGTTDVLMCAPKRDELIFFDAMEEEQKTNDNFTAHFAVTREPELSLTSWKYDTKRIDVAMVQEHATNYNDSIFYLCGSPGFCEGMRNALIEDGIPKEQVRMEKYW